MCIRDRDLNDFHQIRFGVDTHAFHPGSFVLSLIVIIELIAMAVTFLKMCIRDRKNGMTMLMEVFIKCI